jgi:DnaJ-domain-containing protein 1
MGYIFNRIKKITKANINSTDNVITNYHLIDTDDNDLRKAIDELNNKSNSQEKKQAKTNTNNTNQLDLASACHILGVETNADIDNIKLAYKELMSKYHPDKVDHLGDEIKALALKKTQEINSAYQFLKEYKRF